MEISPVGVELVYAEGVTEITELRVVLPYFVNAPKKYDIIGSARSKQHVESDYPVHSRYFVESFYTSKMLYELLFMTNNNILEPNVLPSLSFPLFYLLVVTKLLVENGFM
jgi:hypothetical protein